MPDRFQDGYGQITESQSARSYVRAWPGTFLKTHRKDTFRVLGGDHGNWQGAPEKYARGRVNSGKKGLRGQVLNSTIGFAILGTGVVSAYHQQAIAANADLGVQLVAVGGHNRARFAAISAAFGVPCFDFDELLARPDIDVICICTPSGHHARQAVAAAAAGKHVLVEKPMALTLDDADAMISAAERAGVKLGVVLQRRAEPVFQQVRAAIQAGDPAGVQAYAATVGHQIEVEDVLGAVLHFRDGAIATIAATTNAAPGFPHRIELYGTKGSIQIEGEGVLRWQLADPQKATIKPPEPQAMPQAAGAGGDPRGIRPSGHIAILRDFIDAIREDRQPLAPGSEGRRSLATILKIYAATGLPRR